VGQVIEIIKTKHDRLGNSSNFAKISQDFLGGIFGVDRLAHP